MDILQKLQGEDVEVTYEGVIYKGRLVGSGESELYLNTAAGQLVLPMSSVSNVRAKPSREG